MRKTLTNELILISIILTIISALFSKINIFGMHIGFIKNGEYGLFILQVFIYQFIHSGFGHLLSNSIFLLIFGNQLEQLLGRNKYIVFFVLNAVFVATCILIFSKGVTIGISGFNTAILGYLVMNVRNINRKQYIGGMVLITINVLAGLSENISFVGHLSGVAFGVLFYVIDKKFTNKVF